jgi:hypothetical protein
MNDTRSAFRTRAFISVLVSGCFIALLWSGAVLFLSPPGRVANWTNWRIFGLTKHEWTDLHVAFSTVFLVVGLVHVWFNWRPLVNYFKDRLNRRVGFRWEWLAALAACALVFGATRAKLPPFGQLLAWSEELKQSWEKTPERAPVAHAELLTLRELATQAGLSMETAMERLASKGIQGATADVEVRALAEKNQLAPARVYDLLTGQSATAAPAKQAGESHGGGPGGGGPGRKTLTAVCQEAGVDLTNTLARLKAKGIKAEPSQTLRDIAVNNGFERPYELLEIIRAK